MMKRHVHLLASLFCAAILATPAVATARETAHEKANIATVKAFYEASINNKDFDAASKYMGDHYTQHNPTAQDGKDGFRAFLGILRDKFPQAHSEIKEAWADGDFVILHVHSVREPGTLGRAICDIFKLDPAGKIIEHWDVIQDIPASPANSNTMF